VDASEKLKQAASM